MQNIHLGEYGIPITCYQTNDLNLTGATIYFLYTKPSGTTGQWSATKDGTDFYYIFQDGDIDELGVWVVWIIAQWSTTKLLWDRVSFRVKNAPISRIPT